LLDEAADLLAEAVDLPADGPVVEPQTDSVLQPEYFELRAAPVQLGEQLVEREQHQVREPSLLIGSKLALEVYKWAKLAAEVAEGFSAAGEVAEGLSAAAAEVAERP